ncbi:MAG TPA: hypothetical protein PLQ93_07405 [Bacteroidia bacterium]|nr:hypothetical protein [Bacteroidia bacterium]
MDTNKSIVKKLIIQRYKRQKAFSMSIRALSYVILILGTFSCGKDKKEPTKQTLLPSPGYSFDCEDTSLNWSTQEFDTDFGQNVLYYGKLSVWRVIYDPYNSNIIYYLTNEQAGNNHHLWKYERLTKIKTHLTQNVMNNISIGSNGWIAFESQFNIYKIKSDGDSLTQLSFTGALQPRWTEDCKSIFFVKPTGGEVYKYDNKQNTIVDTLMNIFSEVLPYKNFIFYLSYDISTEVMSIVRKNMDNNSSTTIVSRGGPNDQTGESISYWFLNKNGTSLFWFGNHGLSVTNLSTLQSKRVINSGYGSHTWFYYFNSCTQSGQIIATCSVDSVVNPLLRHELHYSWEFSSDGKCRHRVELPD